MRPLARRKPVHLVLKAKRALSPKGMWIELEIERLAKRFALRIYRLAIARDHIHLVIEIPGRKEYVAFIRSLTGLIARKLGKGLWHLLPFTRVASWGKDFRNLMDYLRKNLEETVGLRPYEPRRDFYKRHRARS
jgi:hypothetical protein